MFQNIRDFLNEVKATGKTFKYNAGESDFEIIKYSKTADNGKDIYYQSQYNQNDIEPFYYSYITESALIDILASEILLRDYKNASIVAGI